MSNSLNLTLPFLEEGQAQKHVTVNDAFRRLDQVVQLAVIDRGRTSPPAAPREGDRYIVGGSPSGAWAGRALDVAAYIDGAWEFFDPVEGWLAYVQAENNLAYFSGTGWEVFTASGGGGGTGESVARLGVNATADTTNRLSVRSQAVLFAPDTSTASGDVRLVVSKGTGAATASHVFQTNFSQRAEFGLLGSDDLALKVSGDGTTFLEAFRVDRTTAAVEFARVPRVGGTESFEYSLPSRAAIATTQVPPSVRQIVARGFAVENDGGGGRYNRVTALSAVEIGLRDAAGGFWQLAGRTVTARQAGAVGDGIIDDTAALNLALRSGREVLIEAGVYRVTNVLRTGATYQRILGEGRGRTIISAASDFTLTAPGVIRMEHSWVTVENLQISFSQASASSRATLIKYPPAINITDRTRCRLLRLRFTEAYDGVLGEGNVGGTIMDDVECGAFNVGFRISGAEDTVQILNCRVWPYDFAGNQTLYNVFSDGRTIAFRIGRCDDLQLSNCTPFRSRVIFEATEGRKPFGTITGLSLDGSFSRVEMADGDLTITSLYCTSSVPDDYCILQTGGNLVVSDFSFRTGGEATLPLVHVNGALASCQIQNGIVELGASVGADGMRLTNGQLSVSNVRFRLGGTLVRTGACIRQVNGTLLAIGNSSTRIGTGGAGVFLSVATNGDHVVVGNSSAGWRYDFPTTTTAGVYGPNQNGSVVSIANAVRFAPSVAGTIEGGQIQLAGAGTNNGVVVSNSSGNARVSGLPAGKALLVVADDGTTTISGSGVGLSSGFKIGRGLADEPLSAAVGSLALSSSTTGTNNTAVGRRALTSLTTASETVAIGANAGAAVAAGLGNTFVGSGAGSTTIGSGNTGIGRNAFAGAAAGITNSSALGDGATVQGSNQVQLGNSLTTTYVYGSVANRSDARDKADVRNTGLGLEFVMRLRPVDFRWDYREDYAPPANLPEGVEWVAPEAGTKKRKRFHHGFIAQEVAAVAAALGTDFGGYQDHTIAGGGDVRTIGYDELFAPVVSAIQELTRRVEALEVD